MLLRNTLFALFIICFCSCETKKSLHLQEEYQHLFEQAKIEWKNLNIGESNALFLELLSISNDVKPTKENQRIHLIALNYLGDIYLKVGEKKLAYKQFEQALSLAEKYNNEAYQVGAILNMVRLEEEAKDVERILQDTNIKFGSNKKNKYSLDQIKYALGLLYAKNDRTEDAINIFNELLLENYPDKEKSFFYKGLGISCQNKGDFNTAMKHFNKAMELSEDIDKLNQLNLLAEKAALYLRLKKIDKFSFIIESIKSTANTVGDINLKKRICKLQLKECNQTNNFIRENEVLKELLVLNEKSNTSLGSITLNLKNFELKKQGETEIYKRNFLIIIVLLLTLLLLSGMLSFFLLYKNSVYKSQMIIESINDYIDVQAAGIVKLADYLHDVVNADLAALKMHISILKNGMPADKFKQIQSILKDIIEKIRALTDEINPKILAKEGLIAAIKEKAIKWSCNTLKFTVESNIDKIPFGQYDLEFKLYSCITECLNNIVRHSEASEALITFKCVNSILHITIGDNGIGFDSEKFKGRMEHTIKHLGGEFNIESKKDQGTLITIKVPLSNIE